MPLSKTLHDPHVHAGDIVLDSLRGLLLTRPDLAWLVDESGKPSAGLKVVVRRQGPSQQTPRRCAVICGGGSGHEPAHAGLVGAGLLDAAVCGDVFASPHVKAVLAAIRAARDVVAAENVAGGHEGVTVGVLVIIKNYTGDRLAFGLAAEMARAEGIAVATVRVADDAAVEGGPVTGRRGVAGTVLVEKIAGGAAAAGLDLGAVSSLARAAAEAVVTMGASLTTCSLPGQAKSDRLDDPTVVEVGLGIHGEPGREQVKLGSASELVNSIMTTLVARLRAVVATADPALGVGCAPVALLVNNLGGLSGLEAGILTAAAVSSAAAAGLIVSRLYSAPLMTALDMRGFSLSLLPLNADFSRWLDAPTTVPVWPAPVAGDIAVHSLTLSGGSGGARGSASTAAPAAPSSAAAPVISAVSAACDALIAAREALNELDKACGDADCGSTMADMGAAVKAAVAGAPSVLGASTVQGAIFGALDAAADCVALASGGTSGVLYALMLRAAANAVAGAASSDVAPAALLATALQAALTSAMDCSNAKPGDRTLFDALAPAAAALAAGASPSDVAAAAEAGAAATAAMAPRAGRASYQTAAALAGIVDPGAQAAALWVRAVVNALA